MEYSELEKLWIQYDSKLNHLETLNKRLILETLSRKLQKKINWLQFRNYYGPILIPVFLVVALYPQFNPDSMNDPKIVAGSLLLLASLGFSTWYSITLINKIKKVDLINDTVIKSATQINDYKRMEVSRFKLLFITLPVTLAGVILIGWDGFRFDQNFYLFTAGISLFIVWWAHKQLQRLKKRIDKLVKDINELKEYKE